MDHLRYNAKMNKVRYNASDKGYELISISKYQKSSY